MCCTYEFSARHTITLVANAANLPPGSTVISPAPGATVSLPFDVEASATDAVGIASVEYWFDPQYSDLCGASEADDGPHPDGCKYNAFFPAFAKNFPLGLFDRGAFFLGATFGPDFELTIDAVPPGTYSVWSRVYNLTGEATLSDPITLTVDGNGPFDVNIPVDPGTIVPAGGVVTIPTSVTADAGEIGHVDYFVDGVLLGRVEEAPFELDWNVPAGSGTGYLVRADAFGIGGRTATDSVSVTAN